MTTTPQQPVPDFVPVAKTTDIRPGEGKLVRPSAGRLRGKAMALFNDAGKFYALNYICPHSGGPLGEGTIKDGVVTCPFHGWSYFAETGLSHNSVDHSIAVYELKLEGDNILVGASKKPGAS